MAINQDKLNELLGRMVGDIGAAMSAALVTTGDKLGLYRELGRNGAMTSEELARRTGTSPRMVREWALNQAAGGYIQYDAASGKYGMSEEQKAALAEERSPASMLGAFDIIASVHKDEAKVREAFRTGKGLAWGAHDGCLFCGTERFFAANYRANLLEGWIPALTGVKARLEAGGTAADVGCGHGASTVLLAGAFPKAKLFGYDFHEPSIECAKQRAAAAGVANAVFQTADAGGFPAVAGGYDLVTCFDCLHDMGDPVACARRVKQTLRPGGVWMVVEPAAMDRMEDNLNPVGRVFSAASTMICVPASMAFNGPALGACAGPSRLTGVIKEGGFSSVRIAAQTPFNIVLEAVA